MEVGFDESSCSVYENASSSATISVDSVIAQDPSFFIPPIIFDAFVLVYSHDGTAQGVLCYLNSLTSVL